MRTIKSTNKIFLDASANFFQVLLSGSDVDINEKIILRRIIQDICSLERTFPPSLMKKEVDISLSFLGTLRIEEK